MEKVKAAVLVEPEKIEIQEFDKPSIQADAMLFKIELAGVCGTDVHLYHGRAIMDARQRHKKFDVVFVDSYGSDL